MGIGQDTGITPLRSELSRFYGGRLHALREESMARCRAALDAAIPKSAPAIVQKRMQYGVIAENVTPVLFRHTAFFGEVCANDARERADTMGSWTYLNNRAAYRKFGASVLAEKDACAALPLYTFCGEFGDEKYHFAFENGKILATGFRGVCEAVQARLSEPSLPAGQSDWLEAVEAGCLAVRRMAGRFAEAAARRAADASGDGDRAHWERIAATAARVPWEPPATFYEALETVFFIQQAIPALEGGGLYSLGRLDALLWPFYRADVESGRMTGEEAYRLVCEFLLLFDMRIPHDMPGQDDSLVNSVYTLGGSDRNGAPVFNAVTELFLRATRECDIIYPKIKCRFGADSPREYFDLVNAMLKAGKSTMLYQNDGALASALARAGVAPEDARDHSILGCWEPVVPGCTNEHCSYLSALKILELSVHGGYSGEGLPFRIMPLDGAATFGEVMETTMRNFRAVMESRARVAVEARKSWSLVDPHPLLSATLDDCIAKGRDVTDGGARYNFDEIVVAGLPNVIDSLLAIKELCFDRRRCSLPELLDAVRANWTSEELRNDALRCHFFGDGTEESGAIAKFLTGGIAACADALPALWGGRVTVGYMLFMEMYRWAKTMRATPDGRRDGDFFARGLTPSSLHRVDSITSVIRSFDSIDASRVAANSVLNVTMPYGDIDLPIWEAMMRTIARSSVGALQINCVDREELLDAVAHPERHQSLVVRVCGYSARFTSLPDIVKDDFLSRNFFSK